MWGQVPHSAPYLVMASLHLRRASHGKNNPKINPQNPKPLVLYPPRTANTLRDEDHSPVSRTFGELAASWYDRRLG